MRLGAGGWSSGGLLRSGVVCHRTYRVATTRATPDRAGPPHGRPSDLRRRAPGQARPAGPPRALDPAATHGRDKARGRAGARAQQLERLTDLQDRLWAEAKHSVLVVLQGIDAAGKDGTISNVMDGVQPAGLPGHVVQGPDRRGARPRLPVARSTRRVPAQGRDRRSSTARTTRTSWSSASTTSCRESVWSRRYDQINAFERMLTDERHDDRQVLPVHRPRRAAQAASRPATTTRRKRWKFSMGDLDERKRWDDYQAAFDDVLDADLDRRTRRGTSSRPTASGSATSPSRRSWPTRSPT